MSGLVGVKNAFDVLLTTEDVSARLKREAIFVPPAPRDRRKTHLSKAYKQYREGADNLIELVNELEAKRKTQAQLKFLYEMVIVAHQLDTRALCLYLREVNHMDACWSFSHACHDYFPEAGPRGVLEIILPKIPVPSEKTSWEEIIEFRDDPDSQSKLLAMRDWMNEVARNKLSPKDEDAAGIFSNDDCVNRSHDREFG